MHQNDRKRPEDVFSVRASYYVTSISHTDPEVLSKVVSMAAPSGGMAALDVGTGTGHTAMALAPYVSKVTAVDLTEEMLEEGRKQSAIKGIRNVEFRIGDAMMLPFDDGTFDIVTCRRAAHHFTDIMRSLKEMCRVLKPGGRLVIDDRSVPDDDGADEAMNHLDVLHDPSHVREYRLNEWVAMLEGAGLEVAEVATYRRHQSMAKFTENVDAETAKEMYGYLQKRSMSCLESLNYEFVKDDYYIDHFFVMVMARKA